MPFTDQFWRAIADYGILFPTSAALSGDPSPWLTEYLRIRRTAFAAVLLTASGTEGGNSSGQRQFPQEILADALHCRRYDLDNASVLPAHLVQYPQARVARSRATGGFTVRFGADRTL